MLEVSRLMKVGCGMHEKCQLLVVLVDMNDSSNFVTFVRRGMLSCYNLTNEFQLAYDKMGKI